MRIRLKTQQGFTVIAVCVVVFVIILLLAIFIANLGHQKTRAHRITCTCRLKQVGLASRLWANDHEEQFPFASTNAASSRGWVNSPEVFRHYQAMSNELVTPRILVCPSDPQRKPTKDFTQFSNTNLSYFVGLDAREDRPQSVLSGDRNITGGTLSNGFLRMLVPDGEAGWTKEMHQNAGNIGLGDGSVQQMTSVGLQKYLAAMTNAAIRLAIP